MNNEKVKMGQVRIFILVLRLYLYSPPAASGLLVLGYSEGFHFSSLKGQGKCTEGRGLYKQNVS